MKGCAKNLFIVIGIIAVIIVVAAIASSGKKTGSGSTSITQSTQPASSDQKSEYKVGDTVMLKNHQLVVTKVNKNYASGNEFDKPQSSENTFVVVDVTITNTGSDNLSVNPYGFKLEDETGVQRDTTSGGLADGKLDSVTLSPNGKTSGKIVFEAKAGSKVLKLHYSPGLYGGDDVVISL